MRILAIRGQNLASLAGEFVVDFTAEPLAGSGIFAITGPTGAGKSTLLDAVCLALFNEIPRLRAAPSSGKIGDQDENGLSLKDTRAILRHGTAEGYAEVDFAMPDGSSYRARWSVKRARGKADGKIQAYDHSFERLDTAQRLGGTRIETKEAIRQVIGLTPEQFGRAVLLAQGDFEAFIRADANERAQLLERLTGSEIYTTLGARAFEKAAKLRAGIDSLREQISRQNGLDDTQRVQAEEDLAQARSAEVEALAVREGLKAARQWEERLSQLTRLTEASRGELELAQANNAHAQTRREMLARNRVAMTLVPEWTELGRIERRVHDLEAQVSQGEVALARATELEQQAQQDEQAAVSRCAEVTELAQALAPVLKVARELDLRIAEAARGVEALRGEANCANQRVEEANLQHELAAEAYAKDAVALEQVQGWLQDNAELSVLDLREEELAAGLIQHAASSAHLAQLLSGRSALEKTQLDALQRWESAEAALASAAKAHAIAIKTSADAEAALPPSSVLQALSEKRDALARIASFLTDYDSKAGSLATARNTLDTLAARIDAETTQRDRLAARQDAITARLPELTKQAEQARSQLELLRSAASEAAEALRAQLEPEQPCPVCGSAKHELSLFEGKLGQHLRDREAAAKDMEAQERRLAVEAADLGGQISSLSTSLVKQAREKLRLQGELEAAASRLEDATVALQHAAGEIGLYGAIAALPDLLDAKRDETEKAIEQLYCAREKADQARKAEQQARGELDRTQKSQAMARDALALQRQVIDEHGRKTSACEEEVARLAITLDRHLAALTNWRGLGNPGQWLADNVGAWRERNTQARALTSALPSLQSKVASAAALLSACSERADGSTNKLAIANADLVALADERGQLLDGQSVAEVERSLEARRERATIVQLEAAERREMAARDLAAVAARLEGTNEAVLQGRADQDARWAAFAQALASNDLTADDITCVASAGAEVLEAESEALADLANAVAIAQAMLIQRERELEAHHGSEAPLLLGESLTNALQAATGVCQAAAERRSEADLVLRRDNEVRTQTAQLRAELEMRHSKADVWLRLNDLIGDRTGASFRRFAQGLTLDHLLEHANARLAELKPRYTLERAAGGDMLIQVLDNDMGGEIRGLHNLSGGERFLVSLALALGLAEMSTVSGIKIESLFIDEGFGALDAASLGQAVALLEHLHATGRRVGVISHVEELKERIPIKIEVSPTGRGTSKIQVYSA